MLSTNTTATVGPVDNTRCSTKNSVQQASNIVDNTMINIVDNNMIDQPLRRYITTANIPRSPLTLHLHLLSTTPLLPITTMDSFPNFLNLPPEMRTTIWELSLENRVLEARLGSARMIANPLLGMYRLQTLPAARSGLLGASAESRAIAANAYQTGHITSLQFSAAEFDFARDMIYYPFRSGWPLLYHVTVNAALISIHQLERVRHWGMSFPCYIEKPAAALISDAVDDYSFRMMERDFTSLRDATALDTLTIILYDPVLFPHERNFASPIEPPHQGVAFRLVGLQASPIRDINVGDDYHRVMIEDYKRDPGDVDAVIGAFLPEGVVGHSWGARAAVWRVVDERYPQLERMVVSSADRSSRRGGE